MIDAMTQKPLFVSTDGTMGPYIMVPVSQLPDVRNVLDTHNICYSVEEDAISLDGAPATTVVNLGRGSDVNTIQTILDGVR